MFSKILARIVLIRILVHISKPRIDREKFLVSSWKLKKASWTVVVELWWWRDITTCEGGSRAVLPPPPSPLSLAVGRCWSDPDSWISFWIYAFAKCRSGPDLFMDQSVDKQNMMRTTDRLKGWIKSNLHLQQEQCSWNYKWYYDNNVPASPPRAGEHPPRLLSLLVWE